MPETATATPTTETPAAPPPVTTPAGENATPANGQPSEAATTTETAAPPAAEPPKPQPVDLKSAKFREAAEQEAKNRKRELELKREREAFDKERAEFEEAKTLMQLAQSDPAAYLKKIGKAPDEIAKALLDGDKPPDALAEARKAREELETFKREQAAAAKAAEKAAAERRGKELWEQYVGQTTDALKANADRWEFINQDGAYLAVAQRAAKHWNDYGTEPNVEQIADELEAEIEARAVKYSQTKKWTAKHAPKPPPAAPGKEPKNLTNAATPAAGSKTPSERGLTPEERAERAVRVLKEKMNKKD